MTSPLLRGRSPAEPKAKAERGVRGERRLRFLASELATLREMPFTEAMEAVDASYKADPLFVPTNDPRTRLWFVYAPARTFELVVTGNKWFDRLANVGGVGAISFVCHVSGFDFVSAVKALRSRLPTGSELVGSEPVDNLLEKP